MAPLDGPHKKKSEGARTKAAPLATALSAKRTTRSKPARTSRPAAIPDSPLEPQVSAVVAVEVPISEDAVRLSAYYKWDAAGRPEGDGVSFWLEAERELLSAL